MFNCYRGYYGTVNVRRAIITRVLWALFKQQRRILVGLNRLSAQGSALEERMSAQLEAAVKRLTDANETLKAEVVSVKAQNDEVIGTLAELKEIVSNPPDDSSATDLVNAIADSLGVTVGELKASKDAVDAAEEAADPTPDAPVPTPEG